MIRYLPDNYSIFKSESIMKSRQNNHLEETVKRGIIMSRTHGAKSASGMMMKVGVPTNVIVRVLFHQDKIRIHDLSDWQ